MNSGVPQIVVTHTVSGAGPTAGGAVALTSLQTAQAQNPLTASAVAASLVPAGQAQPAGAAAAGSVTLKIEQKGEIFDFAVTVRLRYASGETEDVIVLVTDRVVERTLPLKGVLRSVQVNEDEGALVEVADR